MYKLDYLMFCFFERHADRFPYIKYIRDKKISYKSYTWFNFWYKADVRDFRLTRFIEHNKLNKSSKRVNFISVFWTRKILKYIDWIRIFFTWENVGKDRFSQYDDYCLNDVDLSIWFRVYNNIDNYVHFPFRMLYLLNAEKTSIEDINRAIESLEKAKLNLSNRKKFCSLISSHDDIERTRGSAFDRVSKYWQVDCPGRLFHNLKIDIPKYEDKIRFLEEYKFNICPENKENIWYVTEKLIDSRKAGCVPIYRGTFWDFEKKVFNKDSIIWIDKNLEKNIENLLSSETAYKDFVEQPIFNNKAGLYIYEHIKNLKKKLEKIL